MKKTTNFSIYLEPGTMDKIREYSNNNNTSQGNTLAMAMYALGEKDAREAEILRQAEERQK